MFFSSRRTFFVLIKLAHVLLRSVHAHFFLVCTNFCVFQDSACLFWSAHVCFSKLAHVFVQSVHIFGFLKVGARFLSRCIFFSSLNAFRNSLMWPMQRHVRCFF